MYWVEFVVMKDQADDGQSEAGPITVLIPVQEDASFVESSTRASSVPSVSSLTGWDRWSPTEWEEVDPADIVE